MWGREKIASSPIRRLYCTENQCRLYGWDRVSSHFYWMSYKVRFFFNDATVMMSSLKSGLRIQVPRSGQERSSGEVMSLTFIPDLQNCMLPDSGIDYLMKVVQNSRLENFTVAFWLGSFSFQWSVGTLMCDGVNLSLMTVR